MTGQPNRREDGRAQEVRPFESAAYELGRRLAQPSREVRVVQIIRREVHLPDGRVLVEEQVLDEREQY